MDLTPSDDQETLRTATSEWLADNMPLEQARERRAELWSQMSRMGWLKMTAPETEGGLGLDHATEALVFAELGRFLAPVGAISSAVAARWLAAASEVALSVPSGDRLRVFDPEGASTALGIFGETAGTVSLPGGAAIKPSLDLSANQAILDPAPEAVLIEKPNAAFHFRLLAAAFALGAADAARDMAAGYAKIREQFDRPIGWFQGIKHPCADMAVRCAVARSQLYYAACSLDADSADAAFHVAAAKRLADNAALENSRMNIQVHGGIGMTDEAAPHLVLKRAHLLQFIAPVATAHLL